jgi:hypothetical protein
MAAKQREPVVGGLAEAAAAARAGQRGGVKQDAGPSHEAGSR